MSTNNALLDENSNKRAAGPRPFVAERRALLLAIFGRCEKEGFLYKTTHRASRRNSSNLTLEHSSLVDRREIKSMATNKWGCEQFGKHLSCRVLVDALLCPQVLGHRVSLNRGRSNAAIITMTTTNHVVLATTTTRSTTVSSVSSVVVRARRPFAPPHGAPDNGNGGSSRPRHHEHH